MRILFLALIALFITSCAKVNSEYFTSSFSVKETKINYDKIADDFSQFIISYYLPNKTTFYFNDINDNKAFSDYFVNTLRNKGYAISNDHSRKNLTFLSYQISQIDNENVIAIFNINESKINVIYKIIENKLVKINMTSFNFTPQN
ncbi:TPA: hypothetical protein R4558_001664 [Campylobacter jejuni]|uniref:Conjugal transfer protein TrbH n=1 Tax=Campylobacter jejuni TaxID=197 RepID=A0A1J6N3I2_CAMJU|nr:MULTISPECIES: hypothetical protein [Campylobacter]OEW14394.1 hypothetical protein AJ935_04310 [Campylobacter sp. BCW_6876]ASI88280.1 hypothetical protein FORC46_p0064 [Campylobacter jejuni]AXL45793.1 hypothetical protein AEI23_07345 [Campylobacter jejuni]EAB5510532.1 hypothetical protein [Campylobacter jejuni]EAC1621153.1 hypothetical protein [Campylobacter jejuni]